mgnify:CR=1 FL=1
MTETACGGTCMQPDDKTAGRVGFVFNRLRFSQGYIFIMRNTEIVKWPLGKV